jgi:rhamnose utilization protein RhaD (predicted bifunctional aldolase and dehydrogenase)
MKNLEECMNTNMSATNQAELTRLRELSARIGNDPMLTQASTGNSSIKLDSVLWIKASGKWMADAIREDILIPLDLADVRERVKEKVDPADRYCGASIETAMHAALPHRVVLHVHCVDTIAWAVRQDAQVQLENKMDGLRWRWIPYVPSGLPLAQEIEKALSAFPRTDVLILGNHGLVLGGDDCGAVEDLLFEVQRRLAISPRHADPTDYAVLAEIADGSSWDLPDDDEVHALATDRISREVLSGGLLHPCQSIVSPSTTPTLFRSVPCPDPKNQSGSRYRSRPFLIVDGCGVVFNRSMAIAQRAMMSGLARVIQRISSSAPVRYLADEEVASSSVTASRYCELASPSCYSSAGEFALPKGNTCVG